MKNRFIFIIILISISGYIMKAQEYASPRSAATKSSDNCLWAKSAGGTNSDIGYGITTDANGNVYVIGNFSSPTITFGTYTLTNAGSNSDIFLVKYNASGNVIWAKSIGGTNNDNGFGISTDVNGNILITGTFNSPSITLGTTTLTNLNSSSLTSEIFVAKYNSSGNLLWAKSAQGYYNDDCYSISTDSNGNVFITGWFDSSSITFGTITISGTGVFVVKYDSSGNVLWAKSAGGNIDYGVSIAANSNGDVFITGNFSSPTITFGTITLTNTNSANDYSDMFIVKYDASGNVIWAKSGQGSMQDYGQGISCDAAGNIFVTGWFRSPNLTLGTTTISNYSTWSSDIYLVKYNSSGDVLWAKAVGIMTNDGGRGLSTDANGNVYMTGFFGTDNTGHLTAFGSINLNNEDHIYPYTGDMFVAKFDPTGYVLWAISAGKTGEDTGYGVSADANGNVFVTGDYNCNNIIFGTDTFTNAGNSDVFIAKYSPCHVPAKAGAISGESTVCQGQNSVTYSIPTIENAISYEWTLPSGATGTSITNSIVVNYGISSVSGNITVHGTNTCGDGVNSIKDIIVKTKPTTPIITYQGSYLHSNAVTGNQWYNQTGIINGATNPNYFIITNGNYYVIATINGCSSNNSDTIQITNADIESKEYYKIINIYPNPISDKLIIEFDFKNENGSLEILNTRGQIIYEGELLEKTTIPTGNFTPGLYVIKLKNGETFEYIKIIKE